MLVRRAQASREMKFYLEQKAILEGRLKAIQHEIRLTDDILKLIKSEMA
jgi:hypothetical protein